MLMLNQNKGILPFKTNALFAKAFSPIFLLLHFGFKKLTIKQSMEPVKEFEPVKKELSVNYFQERNKTHPFILEAH